MVAVRARGRSSGRRGGAGRGVVRDLALAEAAFAALVAPILAELVGSAAKGEYEACLAALAHLRRAHPNVVRFADGGA